MKKEKRVTTNIWLFALLMLLLFLFSPLFMLPIQRATKTLGDISPVALRALASNPFNGQGATEDERIPLALKRFYELDPELQLKLVREEYDRQMAENNGSFSAQESLDEPAWSSLGPNTGAGKINAIAFHPTASNHMYVGADGGGVWESTDGGGSWTPLTDSIPLISVGSLAVAPSSPNIIYLGSSQIGVVKSTDSGVTWQLPNRTVGGGVVYSLSVHPNNPEELVIGTGLGGHRSTDGGASWKQVVNLPFDNVYSVERDPVSPNTLYATTGGSGPNTILKSNDAGATWVEKTVGFPGSPNRSTPRIAIAISPSNPLILYASTTEDLQYSYLVNDSVLAL